MWPKYCTPIGQNSIPDCYKVSPLGILIEEEEENEEEEEDESPYIELYSLFCSLMLVLYVCLSVPYMDLYGLI